MLKAEVLYTVLGPNKWSITRADKTKNTTIHLNVSNQLSHGVQKTCTKLHNSYAAHFLENGKFVSVGRTDKAESRAGHLEVVGMSRSSMEVDSTGHLVWLQRCEVNVRGLIVTFTTRGQRAQGSGHFNIFLTK